MSRRMAGGLADQGRGLVRPGTEGTDGISMNLRPRWLRFPPCPQRTIRRLTAASGYLRHREVVILPSVRAARYELEVSWRTPNHTGGRKDSAAGTLDIKSNVAVHRWFAAYNLSVQTESIEVSI